MMKNANQVIGKVSIWNKYVYLTHWHETKLSSVADVIEERNMNLHEKIMFHKR